MTDTPDAERASRRDTADDQRAPTDGDPPSAAGSPLAGQPADATLSLEDVFEILRNERRQHVLSHLLRTDEPRIELGELSEQIAAIENDKSVQRLASQERKRVYVALYQCHLPKMSGADVVAFDKNRGIVEPGQHIEQFEPYLHLPGDEDDSGVPSVPSLVLATTGVAAYLLAAVPVTGGTVAGGVVVLAGLAAFLAMTVR